MATSDVTVIFVSIYFLCASWYNCTTRQRTTWVGRVKWLQVLRYFVYLKFLCITDSWRSDKVCLLLQIERVECGCGNGERQKNESCEQHFSARDTNRRGVFAYWGGERTVMPSIYVNEAVYTHTSWVWVRWCDDGTDNRQTTDNRQQTTDNRQHTADNRQQTTDNTQQTADSRQQTADNRQHTADNR